MKTSRTKVFKLFLKVLGKFSCLVFILIVGVLSCKENPSIGLATNASLKADSLVLVKMITMREKAMINKDISAVMQQFAEGATWINSQGYYFQGKEHVSKFHGMLAGNDSLDYYYEAGKPRIRMIDPENALAYYGWKMFWYKKDNPADTTFREKGLMTLSAHKKDTVWQWIAITNQHTPWFYRDIEPVTID